jgi:LPS sulfotransferase NodH
MAENPVLKPFGQERLTELERKELEGLDWSRLGVNAGYVIFITGRCGSTWLTHLLEDSGMCGAPHEFFNETSLPFYNESIRADSFNRYFVEVVRKYSSGGRFGFEINIDRVHNLNSIIDLKWLLPREAVTHFWMTRQDIISQAFSFARAKQSGHWHDYGTYSVGKPAESLSIGAVDIWREVLLILRQERNFQRFAQETSITPIPLNYEQMVSDKRMTAMLVMTALKCDAKSAADFLLKVDDKTKRLESGQKYEILTDFVSTYGQTIIDLFCERDTITPDQLLAKLQSRHDMIV